MTISHKVTQKLWLDDGKWKTYSDIFMQITYKKNKISQLKYYL